MVVADKNGTVERRIVPEGLGFSPGVFVDETLLFNELFENQYQLWLLDLSGNSLQNVVRIDHSPDKLMMLERIALAIDVEVRAELPQPMRP